MLKGGSSHEADVMERLFVEHIELVAAEERNDAHVYALLFSQIALFQQFFGNGLQKAPTLFGVNVGLSLFSSFVYLFSHIYDAQNKGKRRAFGRAEFFALLGSKVAILHVVVANAAHFVNVAKATVVVGQNQTVRANYFAGTSTAENTYTLAQ